MRRVLPVVVIMLSVALLATGCDFFRVLAGRPTSKDIEAKRSAILQESYAAATEQSEEVKEEVKEEVVPSVPADSQPVVKTGEKKRFYVIMGAFSSRENADRYAARIKGYGYEPEFFGFTEGRTAVGIGGTDDQEEAKAFMRELKGQDFCPEGVWILDRKKK
ncbi:MAG: SPOR domain-containing protein [Bacteroidales bacterium]|nr:SPOR domain-containing protein [Bacteroidales bacterium]